MSEHSGDNFINRTDDSYPLLILKHSNICSNKKRYWIATVKKGGVERFTYLII